MNLRVAVFITILLAACTTVATRDDPPQDCPAPDSIRASGTATPSTLKWPQNLPIYDHVVVVVEENKDYDQIIGNLHEAPFINKLKAQGASFTRMYGEEHPSQGNYFWLLSGSNHHVGFDDFPPPIPIDASNLADRLIQMRKAPTTGQPLSFTGYAEDLPTEDLEAHFNDCRGDRRCRYVRKHVPWISFKHVPRSSSQPFSDFPTDFCNLPTVAFVIPNLVHDMHDGTIRAGDKWLERHLGPYAEWAKKNNSLLIITFDENNDRSKYRGLTKPYVRIPTIDSPDFPELEYRRDIKNRIATIFVGAHIRSNEEYSEGRGITHVNILRTIEAMYGLPKSGAQQKYAAACGISDDFLIKDIFDMRGSRSDVSLESEGST